MVTTLIYKGLFETSGQKTTIESLLEQEKNLIIMPSYAPSHNPSELQKLTENIEYLQKIMSLFPSQVKYLIDERTLGHMHRNKKLKELVTSMILTDNAGVAFAYQMDMTPLIDEPSPEDLALPTLVSDRGVKYSATRPTIPVESIADSMNQLVAQGVGLQRNRNAEDQKASQTWIAREMPLHQLCGQPYTRMAVGGRNGQARPPMNVRKKISGFRMSKPGGFFITLENGFLCEEFEMEELTVY